MHLQQTKHASRASGGPQYYFHDVPDHVKEFLRRRGACPVVLQTPYGIATSKLIAVGRDHKLSGAQVLRGNVGHDRIVAGGRRSIGEEIRYWYGIDDGDFETIDVEVTIHSKGHFIVVPTGVKMRARKREIKLERMSAPLSFHHDHQSKLWREQISTIRDKAAADVAWASAQINRVVAENRASDARHILEADLLRAAGALSIFGVELSPYLGKGYDCVKSTIQFLKLPIYPCPVEIKKRSQGFTYQVAKYKELPRVLVLCMDHDYINPPEHVDIVALSTLAEYLSH